MSAPSSNASPKSPERRGSRLELVAAICFFVAMLAFTGAVVQRRMSAKGAGDVLGGTVITPTEVADGVTVTPGSARLLLVESTPEGAALVLDGTVLGETPYSSDFRCEGDKPTALEVKKAGFATARFSLACVKGSTRVSVKLKRR